MVKISDEQRSCPSIRKNYRGDYKQNRCALHQQNFCINRLETDKMRFSSAEFRTRSARSHTIKYLSSLHMILVLHMRKLCFEVPALSWASRLLPSEIAGFPERWCCRARQDFSGAVHLSLEQEIVVVCRRALTSGKSWQRSCTSWRILRRNFWCAGDSSRKGLWKTTISDCFFAKFSQSLLSRCLMVSSSQMSLNRLFTDIFLSILNRYLLVASSQISFSRFFTDISLSVHRKPFFQSSTSLAHHFGWPWQHMENASVRLILWIDRSANEVDMCLKLTDICSRQPGTHTWSWYMPKTD